MAFSECLPAQYGLLLLRNFCSSNKVPAEKALRANFLCKDMYYFCDWWNDQQLLQSKGFLCNLPHVLTNSDPTCVLGVSTEVEWLTPKLSWCKRISLL